MSPHVLTLAKDFQGGHQVLRSCFYSLSPPPNELILLRIAQNCFELARNQAGCCILQECIEYSNDKLRQLREVLVSPLIQDADNLSIHPYGNYVIQFMIQLDGANIGWRIINELKNKFVALSMDKFGSNVVEKCLSCCEGGFDYIIYEILENNNENQLLQICTDRYGNYVIQTAMSVAKGNAHRLLERAIKSHWFVLQFHPYGKNRISSEFKYMGDEVDEENAEQAENVSLSYLFPVIIKKLDENSNVVCLTCFISFETLAICKATNIGSLRKDKMTLPPSHNTPF
ncbi:unnamed protein product [Citrullus colocynthis]|uniref:PUM-HD domain-containing protein n=1 Tax=Citrullus colocynthis TaxID=252529 RepID=A0ABP0YAK9_9ROSI